MAPALSKEGSGGIIADTVGLTQQDFSKHPLRLQYGCAGKGGTVVASDLKVLTDGKSVLEDPLTDSHVVVDVGSASKSAAEMVGNPYVCG